MTTEPHTHRIESAFCATRHAAGVLRTAIEAVTDGPVVLDFSGVEAAAWGYLDELVCALARGRAVTVIGANEDTVEGVQTVLARRSMTGQFTDDGQIVIAAQPAPLTIVVTNSPPAPPDPDPVVREVADALYRIETNYHREGTGPGSRFEGERLEVVQARYAVRYVREQCARQPSADEATP